MALTAQNVMTDTVLAVDTATPLSEDEKAKLAALLKD